MYKPFSRAVHSTTQEQEINYYKMKRRACEYIEGCMATTKLDNKF